MPHPFEPVYDNHCRILILGTTPSPLSLQTGFYYGHPRNRFWPLLAKLLGAPVPQGIDQKRALLLAHHIALWDVLSECDIKGASDASIQNAVPNNFDALIRSAPIQAVFLNGAKAYEMYTRFCGGAVDLPFFRLPSTSPANAACTLDKLAAQWALIRDYL